MLLYDEHFFCGQLSRLVENLGRHGELADVMQIVGYLKQSAVCLPAPYCLPTKHIRVVKPRAVAATVFGGVHGAVGVLG